MAQTIGKGQIFPSPITPTLEVNGNLLDNPNFNINDTTPAAPSGAVNVKHQMDSSTPQNLSAYVPAATSSTAGVIQLDSSSSTAKYLNGSGAWTFPLGGVNLQSGTSYTISTSDAFKLVRFNNVAAIAATLPNPLTTQLNFFVVVENFGSGALTLTPATGQIDGSATLQVGSGQGVILYSDGTNYYSFRGFNGMQTTGDIVYGGTGGVPTRLPIGTSGYVLTSSGGVPTWAAAGGGGASIPVGTNILPGSEISLASSINGWGGYTFGAKISAGAMAWLATNWKVRFCFTAGTGLHVAKAYVCKTLPGQFGVVSYTSAITFGGNAWPCNWTFGATASLAAPVYFDTDTINFQLDANHDFWFTMYLDADPTYNSSLGVATARASGAMSSGYHLGDQTSTVTVYNNYWAGNIGAGIYAFITA